MANDIRDYKIWYPYEVFYIESMLIVTRSAMVAQSQLQSIMNKLENGEPNTQDITEYVIDLIQSFLLSTSALSRYFWPVRDKDNHKLRGERLRIAFEMKDDSPLRDRDFRNYMEHFDERLDVFLSVPIAGTFIPSAIGSIKNSQGVTSFIRYFDTNTWTFQMLDKKVPIIPLIKEVIRIFLLLEKFKIEGGRLPQ